MWHNSYGRRILVAQWPRAATEMAACAAERDSLREELDRVKRDRNELRAALQDLCAAVRARWDAQNELAELYRQRDLERAGRAGRAPALRLN
jgi:hypothetical protein